MAKKAVLPDLYQETLQKMSAADLRVALLREAELRLMLHEELYSVRRSLAVLASQLWRLAGPALYEGEAQDYWKHCKEAAERGEAGAKK